MKTYRLPLSEGYVSHWGVGEAVREILQNAIDSDAPFNWDLAQTDAGHVLSFTSEGVRLEPSTLVLGVTSKAGDPDTIGGFGEGYKIALLVLARAGLPVVVHNGPVDWHPDFEMDPQFGVRVLTITELPGDPERTGLTFEVGGLSSEQVASIKAGCLHMEGVVGEVIELPNGRILKAYPGKLFVNGLFVCDTGMQHGYDFKPSAIRLERDRKTVDDWDLSVQTARMWEASGRVDEVAQMVRDEAPDVSYFQWGACPEAVREACYQLFVKSNPGGIVAKTMDELNRLVERGLRRVTVVGAGYYSAVSSSPSYRADQGKRVAERLPEEVIMDFFERFEKRMPRLPKVEFKKLISESKRWRLK